MSQHIVRADRLVAPGVELLADPSRQAGRGVGQAVSERLGLGALDRGVAAFFGRPMRELPRPIGLGRLLVAPDGKVIEMNAGQALGIGIAQA